MSHALFVRTVILVVFVISLAACGSERAEKTQEQAGESNQPMTEQSVAPGDTTSEETKPPAEKATPLSESYDYTAPYVCPNHCEGSGSESPGECPACGMELIENPTH